MMRRLKFVLSAAAILLVLGVPGVGWFVLSTPPDNRAPLPGVLLDAGSAAGRALLAATPLRVDHDQLLPFFVGQSRRAFCGVATAVDVINALRHPQPPLSQATFFSPEVAAIRSAARISVGGLTLEQLAELLRAQRLAVIVVHAAQTDLDSFRNTARAVLAEPNEFLIVNYDRVELGQQGAGHISPVAAYHAGSDRLLVFDVATHKYPPTWVPAIELWAAMNTVDGSSAETRGFLLVRERSQQSNPAATAVLAKKYFHSRAAHADV